MCLAPEHNLCQWGSNTLLLDQKSDALTTRPPSSEVYSMCELIIPPHMKTNNLHMQNKDANQLCSNCIPDQRLCFLFTDSTIPFLPKYQASNYFLWVYSLVCVIPGQKPRLLFFSHNGSYLVNID